MGRPLTDLTGQRFGRLVVVRRGDGGAGKSYWECVCDCGAEKSVAASALKKGHTKSCGCLNAEVSAQRNAIEKRTHGQSRTPLFIVWQTMRRRCHEEKNHAYPNYGGRGIVVCDEWQQFQPFYEWAMSAGYRRGLSIDRINNDGPYCPANCRWATAKEQGNNRRNNARITHNGKTKTVSEWADELGLPYHRVSHLSRKGWSIEQIISGTRRSA